MKICFKHIIKGKKLDKIYFFVIYFKSYILWLHLYETQGQKKLICEVEVKNGLPGVGTRINWKWAREDFLGLWKWPSSSFVQ